MNERLKAIGSTTPLLAKMPEAARRAFEAAKRRGRTGARKRPRVPTKRDGSPDVAAMIRGMKRSVDSDPVARFLDVTGSVPVPDFIVADWRIEMAEKHAERAARRLGTDVPEIRWYRTVEGGQPARGWFDGRQPDAIWLRANLLPSEIPEVVAHEAAHRADHLQGRESTEERAEAFAASFTPPPSRGATRTHQRGQFVAPTTN